MAKKKGKKTGTAVAQRTKSVAGAKRTGGRKSRSQIKKTGR